MRVGLSFSVAAIAVTSATAQKLEYSVDQDFVVQMPPSKTDIDVNGYSRVDLGNAAINAPTEKCPSYIGHTVYRDCRPFDPARCIKDCEETTRFNQQTGGSGICRFVNTYILEKDGKPDGQVCSMYTRAWGKQFAVNTGYYTEDTEYTIKSSYSYSNDKDPGDDNSCLKEPENPEPSKKPEPTYTPTPTPTPTGKHDNPKPTPSPPNEGVECFKARAWAPGNKHLNGRWLDSKNDKSTAYWKQNDKDATPFYIDHEGLWRNAESDSIALWNSIHDKNHWGYVKFAGKDHRKWPQVTDCKIKNRGTWGGKLDELTCGKNNEEFRAKGFLLTWRFGHPKHASPIRIEAVKTHCPKGSKKWW